MQEWKKEGEILIIWQCNRCFKKIPLYKTNNSLVNSIYLSFARNEKYCEKCKKKLNPKIIFKIKEIKEIRLLEIYEGVIEDDEDYS